MMLCCNIVMLLCYVPLFLRLYATMLVLDLVLVIGLWIIIVDINNSCDFEYLSYSSEYLLAKLKLVV